MKAMIVVSLVAGFAAPVLADTVDDILLQKKLNGAYEQDNGGVVVDPGRVEPCDSALMLTCGDTVQGTTVGGTNYVGNPAPDVFFQILVPVGGLTEFTLCDTIPYWDTYLRLYNGCPVSGGTQIASNDDSCGLLSYLALSLAPGTYWLVVEGYWYNSGPYTLTVNCPAPTPCSFPCDYTITPGPGSYIGTIDPYGADWYCLTGDADLTLISTCNAVTNYDTKLELWYNDPTSGCTQLAYDDDDWDCTFNGLFTTLGDADSPFTMVDGGEYYIKVYGYFNSAGTYQLDLNGGQVVSADDQPVSFTLSQNVPNPFNPTTAIAFGMPETGLASLKVYDLAGRTVATLVDGMVTKGEHSVVFDAGNLTSGVYFYTLQAGASVETRKMVLMK
jgi:hypothetical protein